MDGPKFINGLVAAFCIAAAGSIGIIGVDICGLSDQKGAGKVLSEDGRFNVVQYEGHNFLGCSARDLWRDEFKVKNSAGKEVKVVVCQGIFKGSTVRIL
jgi:hypothetical protein